MFSDLYNSTKVSRDNTYTDLKVLDPLDTGLDCTPKYATDGSGACDAIACIKEEITILPGEHVMIPLGFALHIKDPNIVCLLTGRSGMFHKQKLRAGNCVGVIDSDYQGEVKALIQNDGKEEQVIKPGDRICQLLFMPVKRAWFNVVEEFESTTERGTGGFGHTGMTAILTAPNTTMLFPTQIKEAEGVF